MIVMMLMLVMVMLIVVMIVMMLMLVMVMLIVVMVVMFMLVMVVIIMVMMMQVDMHFDGLAVFDDFQHEVRIHIIPGCCDDTGVRMRFLNQNTALFDTIRREVLGTAEDNGGSRLDLVEEEFAEVFHIHAALAGVNNGCRPADFNIVMTVFGLIDRSKNLAQFADTGRLNKNAVRMIGINELVNGLLEIAGQCAADAAGIQFGDCDAGIFHEAAVHTDFTIFIFKQNHFLFAEFAREKLFDQCGFARTKETGNYIDLNHGSLSLYMDTVSPNPSRIIARLVKGYKRKIKEDQKWNALV